MGRSLVTREKHANLTILRIFILLIFSNFSIPSLLSIRERTSLLAWFLRSMTRSILLLESGVMSWATKVVTMSIAFDSWRMRAFWFSRQGPWQNSVSVRNVWFIRPILCSSTRRPINPGEPVFESKMQSRKYKVWETKSYGVLLPWVFRYLWNYGITDRVHYYYYYLS